MVRPKRSTRAPSSAERSVRSKDAALALANVILPVASKSKMAVGNCSRKASISGVSVLISAAAGVFFLEKNEKKLLDICPLSV